MPAHRGRRSSAPLGRPVRRTWAPPQWRRRRRHRRAQPDILRPLGRSPLAVALSHLRYRSAFRIRLDQAGIDRKAFTTNQPLVDTALENSLEHPPQQIALAEAAMPVLGEGRMIGHAAIEAKSTEPPIGQIEVDLLAQAPLGADTKAVADDEHPDHQLRIDRWPPKCAVKWRQVAP